MLQTPVTNKKTLERDSTSNVMPTCPHLAKKGRLLFCELFDRHLSTGAPAAETAEPAEQPDQLKGLCVNCEHRLTCTYRRPIGGVWHCEEYE